MSAVRRMPDGSFQRVSQAEINAMNAQVEKQMMPYFNALETFTYTSMGALVGVAHLGVWTAVRELYIFPLPTDFPTSLFMGAAMVGFALSHAYGANKAFRPVLHMVHNVFSRKRGISGK